MLMLWIILSVLVLLILIGLAVYFLVLRKPKSKIPKPPKKRANILIGYAQPWECHWRKLLSSGQHIVLANNLLSTGCTMTLMELDLSSIEDAVNYASVFLDRDIKVEIIMVNGNSQNVISQSDNWFIDRVEQIKKRLGTRNILFMPVCEPGNRGGDKAKVQRWMDYGYNHWDGETVVNIGFDWSTPFLSKAHYHEKHHCKMFDDNSALRGQRYISTTDCGPMINLDSQKTYQLAKACIKKNSHFISYHASMNFGSLAIDWGKIEGLKKAIAES